VRLLVIAAEPVEPKQLVDAVGEAYLEGDVIDEARRRLGVPVVATDVRR
jgi:hypothetical protein